MLDGPYLAGCLLLVVAGIAKARRPDDTARAMAQIVHGGEGSEIEDGTRTGARSPFSFGRAVIAVRGLAVAEIVIGLAGLSAPSLVSAALVAASYLGVSGFVVAAIVRGGPLATCGCFAKADTPPTITHVLLTIGIAASAAAVAAAAPPGWPTLWAFLGRQPLAGVPMLLSSVALAGVAWLAMTLLPSVKGAR